ncbi:MAG: hypothetical protein JW819_13545 [Candidatus Krumholzibacteriota bacterium]|nr:hypothetical protein [Candidatus Krumholzibacteriota bacterium]
MSDHKLQELIETLRKQAVESGEASSREIVEEARQEAEAIVERAKAEADEIVRRAQAEADGKLKQLESSMEIASSQTVTRLKRAIETNLLALPLSEKVNATLADTGFLEDLIRAVALEYTRHHEKSDLQVLVSEEQRERLVDFMLALVREASEGEGRGHKGLTLHAENVDFGFMINRMDGNVTLDFTGEAFLALFLKFLTPRFRQYFKNVTADEGAGE